MGLPRVKEARDYYRAAMHRAGDAALLREFGRTTGAVYLAGYAVECMLKALLLDGVGRALRKVLLADFHGTRAHNIEWLGALYRQHVGLTVPLDVARHLARVASWSTDLRYGTGTLKRRDADEFMESVQAITGWADRRM